MFNLPTLPAVVQLAQLDDVLVFDLSENADLPNHGSREAFFFRIHFDFFLREPISEDVSGQSYGSKGAVSNDLYVHELFVKVGRRQG